jgi:hypothetical protein
MNKIKTINYIIKTCHIFRTKSRLICLVLCLLLLFSCAKKLQPKVSFHDIRKAEIAARQKQSRQKLEKASPIDENYAVQLINNANSSFYPKKSGALNCIKGKVVVEIFEDSARTKRSATQLETLYDKNGLTKRSATYIDKALFSEDTYYRNAYNLIDSIVSTDQKGLKTSSVFKYRKDQFSVISIDRKNVMISNIFYLNRKFQCVKTETLNGSGDLVGTTFFKYDDLGRIIEEVSDTRKMTYEYKNQQTDFYSSMKFYDIKDGTFLSENRRYEDKDKVVFISKNGDKVLSKTISLNNVNGCTHIVYNYNAEDKLTAVYEYLYEN